MERKKRALDSSYNQQASISYAPTHHSIPSQLIGVAKIFRKPYRSCNLSSFPRLFSLPSISMALALALALSFVCIVIYVLYIYLAERAQRVQPQSGHQNRDLRLIYVWYVRIILSMRKKGHCHGDDL